MNDRYLGERLGRHPQASQAEVVQTLLNIWIGALLK